MVLTKWACIQVFEVKFLESVINNGSTSFGGITSSPKFFAEPETEFSSQSDYADKLRIFNSPNVRLQLHSTRDQSEGVISCVRMRRSDKMASDFNVIRDCNELIRIAQAKVSDEQALCSELCVVHLLAIARGVRDR